MQPLGRRPVRFPNKIDHHVIHRGKRCRNWWESEYSDDGNKAIQKRADRKEIEKEFEMFDLAIPQKTDNHIEEKPFIMDS